MTLDPKISIIILNWNGMEDTMECLESLKKITYPNYEVILVDNGSKSNDAEVLAQRYGDYIHIIRNDKNYGFAEGNNIGIRYALEHSNPEYILLLNNDTVVHPTFLDKLVEAASGDPRIGIAGPKVYSYDQPDRLQSAGGRLNWWTGDLSLIGWGEVDAGQFEQSADVDWVFGCALMIKVRAIEEIGLMSPEYFSLAEETDWCVRCTKAGYRVISVPTARIRHKGGRDISRVRGFRFYYIGRNKLLFMKRNATRLQLAVFLPQFFLRHMPLSLFYIMFRHRDWGLLRPYFRGVCDGLRLTLKKS